MNIIVAEDLLPEWWYTESFDALTAAYRDCERSRNFEYPFYTVYEKILGMCITHISPPFKGTIISSPQRRLDGPTTVFSVHPNNGNVTKYLTATPDSVLVYYPGPIGWNESRRCQLLIEIKRQPVISRHSLREPPARPYSWITDHNTMDFALRPRDDFEGHLGQVILQAFVAFHSYPDHDIIYHALVRFCLFRFTRPQNLVALPQKFVGEGKEPGAAWNKVIVSGLIPLDSIEVVMFNKLVLAYDGDVRISLGFMRCFLTVMPPNVWVRNHPRLPLGSEAVTGFTPKAGNIIVGKNLLRAFYEEERDETLMVVFEDRDSEAGDPSYVPGQGS
ncbi:uncharacterized protein EI90DRAFT_3021245 [Cantharellus anzutake]|uniref:uncharacterized protein n=1 Tax=Cantharellus anzutake TaxID=1750568 RepID=UPI00190405C8|nr:uncharacterized protein EI90DRAFT_3021245 [Cantharellus anzutake]KAF8317845.1 hypothetical protein EI90DRAFT_3021245 [Cantharellus anzutake]